MKTRLIVAVVGLAVLSAAVPVRGRESSNATRRVQTRAASTTEMGPEQARVLLDRYCVTCHNERVKAGSLVLESGVADVRRVGEHGALWEKAVRQLQARLMPPAGARRPDEATYQAFATWLTSELDAEAAAHPNPGRTPTFRRLNRTEYQNAIRDLLALDIDASEYVPSDDAAHGFDNIGGVVRLSSTLMESYLSAADKISRMALGALPSVVDKGQTYSAGGVQQHDRLEGMPLGTRGGVLVTHHFPHDGEYSFSISVRDMLYSGNTHTMELLIDGAVAHVFSVKIPGSVREDLAGLTNEENTLFVAQASVSAGPHEIAATFHRTSPALPEHQNKPFEVTGSPLFGGTAGPGGPAPTVSAITIGGPFNPTGPGETPSRQRILTCQPTTPAEEDTCAQAILTNLARRAFRRPDPDITALLSFYTESRQGGASFEVGIQKALWLLLASPEFLFRVEAAPLQVADGSGSGLYRLDGLELASRLSFFLWSSIPDDRLLDLAAQGRLTEPAVLADEVRRMLKDPRSEALTANFAGQWLELRKLASARPGAFYRLNFDESLRQGLQRETELFFDSIVRENRPITELLTADYTFLNERVCPAL